MISLTSYKVNSSFLSKIRTWNKAFSRYNKLNPTLTFPLEVRQVWAEKPGSARSHEPEPCCSSYWPSPSAPPRRRAWGGWLSGKEGERGKIHTLIISFYSAPKDTNRTFSPSAEKTSSDDFSNIFHYLLFPSGFSVNATTSRCTHQRQDVLIRSSYPAVREPNKAKPLLMHTKYNSTCKSQYEKTSHCFSHFHNVSICQAKKYSRTWGNLWEKDNETIKTCYLD